MIFGLMLVDSQFQLQQLKQTQSRDARRICGGTEEGRQVWRPPQKHIMWVWDFLKPIICLFSAFSKHNSQIPPPHQIARFLSHQNPRSNLDWFTSHLSNCVDLCCSGYRFHVLYITVTSAIEMGLFSPLLLSSKRSFSPDEWSPRWGHWYFKYKTIIHPSFSLSVIVFTFRPIVLGLFNCHLKHQTIL